MAIRKVIVNNQKASDRMVFWQDQLAYKVGTAIRIHGLGRAPSVNESTEAIYKVVGFQGFHQLKMHTPYGQTCEKHSPPF